MKNTVICHISTAHSVFDVRIFQKECRTLAQNGYDVNLLITHDKKEVVDGVKIHPLTLSSTRLSRISIKQAEAIKKALKIDADVYHLHDPELIPLGLILKMKGKKIIYDAHEDLPRQIFSKPYLYDKIKPLISKAVEFIENNAVKQFDAVITATPYIRDRFLKINKNSIDINNFPLFEEYNKVNTNISDRENAVCYIGGLTQVRGLEEVVKSFSYLKDTKLYLAGSFENSFLEDSLKHSPSWKNVEYLGFIDRSEVQKILAKVKAGIVTFLPLPNHINSQPNKMFEYMGAGLPVIGSNFPLWKEIIEGNNCGICVNPKDSKEIADAIKFIIDNPKEAEKMGKNGAYIVRKKYNWEKESKKLLEIYDKL